MYPCIFSFVLYIIRGCLLTKIQFAVKIVFQLAAKGLNLVLMSRSIEKLAGLAAELGE